MNTPLQGSGSKMSKLFHARSQVRRINQAHEKAASSQEQTTLVYQSPQDPWLSVPASQQVWLDSVEYLKLEYKKLSKIPTNPILI
jgi:hypothetical protein